MLVIIWTLICTTGWFAMLRFCTLALAPYWDKIQENAWEKMKISQKRFDSIFQFNSFVYDPNFVFIPENKIPTLILYSIQRIENTVLNFDSILYT